jgi:hypothetical protein
MTSASDSGELSGLEDVSVVADAEGELASFPLLLSLHAASNVVASNAMATTTEILFVISESIPFLIPYIDPLQFQYR